MSKTFFKRSFKQKKYGKYGRWSETRKFFVSHWYKTKNKNILKTYFNFFDFLRSNLYISFCICLCFFRYYLLCMLELIHFFTLVPSTFLHSKRSEFRWDTLIILFHRKIKLAFKPFSGEMGWKMTGSSDKCSGWHCDISQPEYYWR